MSRENSGSRLERTNHAHEASAMSLGKMQMDCTTFEQLEWRSILKQDITVDQSRKLSKWVDAKEISMAIVI